MCECNRIVQEIIFPSHKSATVLLYIKIKLKCSMGTCFDTALHSCWQCDTATISSSPNLPFLFSVSPTHITPHMLSVIRKSVRRMCLTLAWSGVCVWLCVRLYLARWHFGSTMRCYKAWCRCAGGGCMGHQVTNYCRGKASRGLLMFTGALANT